MDQKANRQKLADYQVGEVAALFVAPVSAPVSGFKKSQILTPCEILPKILFITGVLVLGAAYK